MATSASSTASTTDDERHDISPDRIQQTALKEKTASEDEALSEKREGDGGDDVEAQEGDGYKYNPGDRGFIHVKKRQRFYQFWRPKELPAPPPLSLDDAKLIPLENASWFSVITYQWAQPIMVLGYQRALEATDLYKLGEKRSAKVQSEELLRRWDKRVQETKAWNEDLVSGKTPVTSSLRRKWQRQNVWLLITARSDQRLSMEEREKMWRAPRAPLPSAAASGAAKSTGDKKKDAAAKAEMARAARLRKMSGHKDPQIYSVLIEMFRMELAIGAIFKVIGDVAQMTSPLLVHAIINFGTATYAHRQAPEKYPNKPSTGKGVGYSIALLLLQMTMSIGQHQFFFRSMSVGVHARATLISALFTRSMNLPGKDRSPGKLLNHASTDCSRIDFAAQWGVLAFISPIAFLLCVGLLLGQIQESALVGVAVLLMFVPIQGITMRTMFGARRASMVWTDKRSKLINELLSSIRVVKSFAQESKFLERLAFLRRKELLGIRKLIIVRSLNNAIAFSLPVICAVVSFIVYNATGNGLNPAKIFTALTLFQLLRLPLMFLPLSFSALTDGYNASLRLNAVFLSEQLADSSERDPEAKFSLELKDATFVYDEVKKQEEAPKSKKQQAADKKKNKKRAKEQAAATAAAASGTATPTTMTRMDRVRKSIGAAPGTGHNSGQQTPVHGATAAHDGQPNQLQAEQATDTIADGDKSEAVAGLNQVGPQITDIDGATEEQAVTTAAEKPFRLENLNMHVYPGELVAIVGPVGSGKSTVFESLVGEVKMTNGRLVWGAGAGKIAYCPQSPWIQAASVRENILFGRPFDEERYWEVINRAELESDLVILPQGDETEIGEKGTTLSGGQKARVTLARALYFDADTYLLDDPLSAVDPHVGKALFNNAILGLKQQGKTVLLVTHAIHVLPQVDRIITMQDGQIAEMGTYSDLEKANGPFSRLVEEFGGEQEEEKEKRDENEDEAIEGAAQGNQKKRIPRSKMTDVSGKKALLAMEERNTGSVGGNVWAGYMKAGHGWILVPALLFTIALMQGATVMNSYWLVWWQQDQFHESSGFYMGIYAALGISQAITTFFTGASTGIFTYYAARNLHADAIKRILYAPLNTFFDVQPKGRIMNRMTKDIDTLDNLLPDSARMAVSTLGSVVGAIILITVLTNYFIAAVAGVMIFYVLGSIVYRRGAREVKRLDAVLRSALYSHFSETLVGLATVRAYGESGRFLQDHLRHVDIENRAYFFSICNQRFLGVRLDFLGAILVFITAILASVGADKITPSEVGLALSFMLTVSQAFSWATRQVAEVENDMNSAERIQYYATELEQEARQDTPKEIMQLDAAWPKQGAIEFENVKLRYRPGLPIVLKGIDMSISAGEKTAVVGRTGAGKSSLLTCLLRLIELEEGKISIDGVDIRQVGLTDLRTRIGYLPQDPVLFSGTIRSNLDPFGQYDDSRLWDALKRSYLVGQDSDVDHQTALPSSAAAEGGEKHHHQQQQQLTLDTPLEEEGNNLSLGQRSLVSLARALVKDSQIILLDEATASVDVQTDALIQQTIRTEFAKKTLITIAHRLRTVIAYDRIAVFEQGRLEEYDTPTHLFDQGGLFFQMCQKAHITREDVVRAQQQK